MIEIGLKEIEKYYGANQVLKNVSLDILQGEHVGLLGRNGAGKSTLFRIIAGQESPDKGQRMVRKGAVIGMLEQIPEYPAQYTADEVMRTAFGDLHAIQKQLQELEQQMAGNAGAPPDDSVLTRYGRLQEQFEVGGGYAMEDSMNRVCTGLKMDARILSARFVELSGGEKTRVLLGKLFLTDPDILLLDEPTNHLDLQSMEWLEEFIAQYRGTVVVISHDRYFLDRTVERIIELTDSRAESYPGNYSFYATEKEERTTRQLEKYEQEQKKIKQLEDAARRMHEWAKNADNPAMHKRAFSIEKRIERMEKTEKPRKERRLTSGFTEQEFSSREVIRAEGICKSFESRRVLDGLDFIVFKEEHTAILGDNGSGKSTLLKLITGELLPDIGCVKLGDSIRYAYLPQVVLFEEDGLSILETVRNCLKINEGEARALLAKYRFRSEDVHKVVGNLSGGEKSRLRLCLLMQAEVNLLILDEPTNHLDIESREWLEKALEDFGGTLVFVSHDRYFIRRFATRVSELQAGKITDYDGGYEFYRTVKASLQASCQSDSPGRKPLEQPARHEVQNAETPAAKGISKNILARVQELEKEIEEEERQLAETERSLEGCGADYVRLAGLLQERDRLKESIDRRLALWESLQK